MYKLIIIDDEEKIASGMAQLFPWQNIGFEVVQVFTSARKALQYIAENPVDVVLTDIEMPDMNGLELSHCNLVRRTEKGRLRRRGWGLRWEKAQKGGKGTNLRGFFED